MVCLDANYNTPLNIAAMSANMSLSEYLDAMGRGEQSRLARLTGYSQALISQLASGKRKFTVETAKSIAAASYGMMTASGLLGLDEDSSERTEECLVKAQSATQ